MQEDGWAGAAMNVGLPIAGQTALHRAAN